MSLCCEQKFSHCWSCMPVEGHPSMSSHWDTEFIWFQKITKPRSLRGFEAYVLAILTYAKPNLFAVGVPVMV